MSGVIRLAPELRPVVVSSNTVVPCRSGVPRLRFRGICRRAPDRTMGHPSADLLRQLDDEPRRAAHVAEPVAVLVVLQLADELAAMRSQAGEGCLDVVDDEEDVADARGVGRRRPVVTLV